MDIKVIYTCIVCGRTYEAEPYTHKLIGEWEVPEDWREIAIREGKMSYPMYHVCYERKCQDIVTKGLNDFFNKLATKRFNKQDPK